jgi:maltokinase
VTTAETGQLPVDVLALLADWLPTQRWFAGKGRAIEHIDVLSDTTLDAGFDTPVSLHHLVLGVHQGGEIDVYQVPLGRRQHEPERLSHVTLGWTDGAAVYDALHDRDLMGRLIELFDRARPEHTGGSATALGALTLHREEGAALPVGEHSLVLTGEQSNTSLAFGSTAILKVFRRLVPGTNPDIEVHDALTRDGCPNVAPLLGWIDGSWRDPGSDGQVEGSLAMLQTLLVSATDGWRLAQTSLRDLFAEGDLTADEVGGDFAAESHRLGVATATVHASLARTLEHGSRDREGNATVARWMRARLDEAVAHVPALKPYAPALRGALADLAVLDGPTPIQRVHGDYHLGQVMRTTSGWKLLDFEGEPSASRAERTALDSPLRDVAGMLRSFDYAGRQLLIDEPPGPAAAQKAYRAAEWAERNRAAFCDGYASAAGADPRDDAVLLRAYEVDKAVYEAVYEARNRPAWLPIPLAAVDRLATEPGASRPGLRQGGAP